MLRFRILVGELLLNVLEAYSEYAYLLIQSLDSVLVLIYKYKLPVNGVLDGIYNKVLKLLLGLYITRVLPKLSYSLLFGFSPDVGQAIDDLILIGLEVGLIIIKCKAQAVQEQDSVVYLLSVKRQNVGLFPSSTQYRCYDLYYLRQGVRKDRTGRLVT